MIYNKNAAVINFFVDCTLSDLASMGNPRYYGMAHTNHRMLYLQVRWPFFSKGLVGIANDSSSLHATPMFLISSYVPAFEKVNRYFTPSQW